MPPVRMAPLRLAASAARAVVAAGAALAAPCGAAAQPAATANWTGAIRCELQATAPGYSHQETQTWTLTGATPAQQGSVTVYPATWSVTAQGWHDRSRNASRRVAQWTANVPGANAPVSAPVGFTLHPLGRQFDVAKWHAQLTVGGGYTGPDQFINDGVAQPAGRLVQTVYEWQFPKIEAAASDTQLTGSNTAEVRAFVGPLQPAEAQATVTCTWALGRGTPPALPASTMQPTAPPASGGGAVSATAPGGAPGSAPASGAPAVPPAGAPPGGSVATGAGVPPAGGATATIPDGSPTIGEPPGAAIINAPPRPANGGIAVSGSPAGTSPGSGAAGGPVGGVTAATAVDPANFTARQTADGTVVLTWTAVAGAGSYLVGGPGTDVGVMVSGTSHTVTGILPGSHTWTVATNYDPGGVLTTADRWSRATASVRNSSGRYRVLMTGFRVNRATFDDRVNGNGDEVFAAAAVTTIDRRTDSVLQARTVLRGTTYGDTSRDAQRVRAGSFSASGGLWAGDVVPPGSDPRIASAAPSSTRFPLALWEGTLRDGIDAVVVNPVLWEEDGQLEYYNEWADPNSNTRRQAARAAAQAAAVKDRASRADLTPFRGMLVFICSSASDLIPDCKPGNDRPIGINRESCVGDTFASNLLAWCDVTVVVTREAIENALSGPAIGGSGPGAIAIPLVEPGGVDLVKGGLDGHYELYLRVERLP